MKVKVLFFGFTHDLTGLAQEEIELREGECLEDVWRHYESRFPDLGEVRKSLLVAVNERVAESSSMLRDGDEVAFLPPVSGGAPGSGDGLGTSESLFRLTRDTIRAADLAQRLSSPEDGAVVVFEGIVRNNSRGRRTLYLEYEGYEPMAVRKMEEIGREAKERFRIARIAMVHRRGRLEIGETSVAVVVTAAHRGPAFEACRYAIDRLKQIVPIWKKEYFEDGAAWAEGEQVRNQKLETRN